MEPGEEVIIGEDEIVNEVEEEQEELWMARAHNATLRPLQTVWLAINQSIMRFPSLSKAAAFFSTKRTKPSATAVPSELRVINSHQAAGDAESARAANEKRIGEIKAYQKEMARTRRSHAAYAQSLPTKSQLQSDVKAARSQKRTESWSRYVDGLKKCWNPPVAELQATGKIPKRDEAKRAAKAQRGQANLMQALKQSVLMKRKYLNYLGTEIVPSLVTPDNLDAKIQEAVDGSTDQQAGSASPSSSEYSLRTPTHVASYNATAEAVVESEKEVKRKLKEIRVLMDEYDKKNENEEECDGLIWA